ncbi:MAG TPA: gamma-glutamyltransferase, partial [Gaiellaceae bacterium]|nr:gamma-glutamyltransferase [Gaiellaceae bacterium]
AVGRGGAAATVDPLGTQAAIQVLRRGGNAVDAAVAAAATLGVTEPYSCGIGGGGFFVIYRAADRKVFTIDHREKAPAAMRPDSFIDPATGNPMPFAQAVTSGLSAGVPGTLAGWQRALDRFGSMPLSALLQPAIRVAEQGFVVDQIFFNQTLENRDRFRDFTTTRAVFLTPAGEPYPVGTVFRNPQLADTYRQIARNGIDYFYDGPVADAIVDSVQRPPVTPGATRVVRPGLMTRADLEAYRAPFRPPAVVTYRGLEMNGMGPPSSGGSTIGEALNILEGYNPLGATRTEAYHRFIEASALSFADRNVFLGDADYLDIPLEGLLDDAYAAERRTLIGATASPKPRPAGNPWPYQTGAPTAVRQTEGGSTTHLTVSDKWGNVVSYTFTIESIGGNGIVAGNRGFLLNNELTDFDFTPGLANSPAGGKRPRSSMSPTIMVSANDDRPRLALGSPGGARIITAVLQVLLHRIDLGMTLPEAVAAPRISNRNGANTDAEPAFLATPEAAALQLLGHRFVNFAEIGAVTGIEFFRPTAVPQVQAAAEPVRRGGGNAQVAPAGTARACVLGTTPRRLREGVRTTIRLTLRRALGMPTPSGTRIVARGAGVNRTVRTNARGIARVTLRPRRAGAVILRAPSLGRCTARLAVRAAPVAPPVRLTGSKR